jgi:hypothetical protein
MGTCKELSPEPSYVKFLWSQKKLIKASSYEGKSFTSSKERMFALGADNLSTTELAI